MPICCPYIFLCGSQRFSNMELSMVFHFYVNNDTETFFFGRVTSVMSRVRLTSVDYTAHT